MDTIKQTKKAMQKYSKRDLAQKIGIARTTLDIRIEKQNWKKGELKILMTL